MHACTHGLPRCYSLKSRWMASMTPWSVCHWRVSQLQLKLHNAKVICIAFFHILPITETDSLPKITALPCYLVLSFCASFGRCVGLGCGNAQLRKALGQPSPLTVEEPIDEQNPSTCSWRAHRQLKSPSTSTVEKPQQLKGPIDSQTVEGLSTVEYSMSIFRIPIFVQK